MPEVRRSKNMRSNAYILMPELLVRLASPRHPRHAHLGRGEASRARCLRTTRECRQPEDHWMGVSVEWNDKLDNGLSYHVKGISASIIKNEILNHFYLLQSILPVSYRRLAPTSLSLEALQWHTSRHLLLCRLRLLKLLIAWPVDVLSDIPKFSFG